MIYDGLSYVEQMRQVWELHKDEPEMSMTSEEFLSKFLKTDKIYPVITLVLYYGTDKWDASTDLYGMFPKDEVLNELLKPYVSNYRINLVDASNIEQVEKFRTDLQKIFGMLQYSSNKNELINYIQENQEFFRNVDGETYEVIREFLHSERILKKEVSRKKEEKIDMCQALEELYNEGVESGVQQGANQKLVEQVTKKLARGKSVEEIADALEESVETIEKIVTEIQG